MGHVESYMALLCQLQLHGEGFYHGDIDGKWGPKTQAAYESFKKANPVIKVIGKAPPAPATKVSVSESPKALQEDAGNVAVNARVIPDWPMEKDVPAFFGDKGLSQTLVMLPYTMRLAWPPHTLVSRISCHAKVAPYVKQIFTDTLDYYGKERIQALGLDLFGGCLNVRKMRGGSSWSMHSWGIAIDLDPDNNELHMGRDKARFARAEYEPFWKIVESTGAISLGRVANYDWMHFQFAKRNK